MAGQTPTAGAVLSLVGGIFILLGGAVMAVIGTALSFFLGGLAGLFFIGLLDGILVIVMAILMFVAPQLKAAWGGLTIVFAILSLPFAFVGGFFIGFLLALIGGILAIVYKPPVVMMAPPPMMMPPPPPMGAPPPMGTAPPAVCPSCGGPVDTTRRVCTRCGRAV